jgi:undecaprenyl diphosphate synthase
LFFLEGQAILEGRPILTIGDDFKKMERMSNNLPQHIAIIPDGTRRWARKRGLPDIAGAIAGMKVAHQAVDYLLGTGVGYLTMWGFSTDNWKRPEEQVGLLLEQAQTWIEGDAPWLHSRGARLSHIGRMDRLPAGLKQTLRHYGEVTRQNTGMTVMLAFDYGGRAELVEAIRRVTEAGVPSQMVNEELVRHYLYTDGVPDVDLVIRTGGELRLSNFMIWQAAYSEYYFTPVLWPDFDEVELKKALEAYGQRHRRFGGD